MSCDDRSSEIEENNLNFQANRQCSIIMEGIKSYKNIIIKTSAWSEINLWFASLAKGETTACLSKFCCTEYHLLFVFGQNSQGVGGG